MKNFRVTSAVAALALGMASFGAQAVIVNIDARSSTGTNLTLDGGTYLLSVNADVNLTHFPFRSPQ